MSIINNEKVSVITLLDGEEEFIPLILNNYLNFTNLDDLELFVIDDGKKNLSNKFFNIKNCTYLHLDSDDKNKFMDQIIEGYKQPNKNNLLYQKKCKILPSGFKRDYGCGMSDSNFKYIFHMNKDCIYNKKTIVKKIEFLKKTCAECIYCDTTLCYDIYNDQLYKTVSPNKIYESTLLHTREFWKRKGFQWSDIDGEGRYFHYNNGVDRKMEKYYDTIQVLSIHNINMYNPIKIELENMDIKIPEITKNIKISKHPFEKKIEDVYDSDVKILGIESKFLENIKRENWETNNIQEKWKQTKLSKMIKEKGGETYNILFYGSNHPAWELFNKIDFDIIILETSKNYEQMVSIILGSKKNKYLSIKGLFINEKFLD